MNTMKSLNCYNCNYVMLDLPAVEIKKLEGLNFECDCCGHENLLAKDSFKESTRLNEFRSFSFNINNLV